jgi:3-deoxy-D-manno-octulosonate 8-phosphate phosphatase (KDO 8-P phosphatase)
VKPSAAALRRMKKLRLLAMDVDGVLTDGKIIIMDSGEEVKEWNVKDRIGFFMARRASPPFALAWITGRKSKQVESRAAEIGARLHQHADHKGEKLSETAASFGLSVDQAVFIGDDLVDLPALARAGLAVCPSDAHPEVKKACHWVTDAPGGAGVFREVFDAVLKAQGRWDAVLDQFKNPARRPNP